jgi:hypothetical protein
VLDLCDDHEALAAVDGRYWTDRGGRIDYSAEIGPSELWRLRAYREFEAVVCGAAWHPPRFECPGGGYLELQAYLEAFLVKPPVSEVLAWAESNGLDCLDATTLERRYVYVTRGGPSSPAKASVEAAVEAYRQRIEQYSDSFSYELPPVSWRVWLGRVG